MTTLAALKAHLTRLENRAKAGEIGLDAKMDDLKAWMAALAANGGKGLEIERRLRKCSASMIRLAKERQRKKAERGKPHVAVEITVEQLMAALKAHDYRCALTGLPFWSDDGGSYGPTTPSMDRIDPDGNYVASNVRVVCLGINGLRGHGSDAQMYAMAEALLAHQPGAGVAPQPLQG